MRKYSIVPADVLIIGGGGAALRAAIAAKEEGAAVVMAVKGKLGACGSTSVAFAETTMITGSPLEEESGKEMYEDILKAGMGTVSPGLAEALVRDCGQRVKDLERYGLKMQRRVYSQLNVSGFAHSAPRTYIISSRMEHSIQEVLIKEIRNTDVAILEGVQIVRLLTERQQVVGAVGIKNDDSLLLFKAGAVVLACGGAHGIFPHHPSTGDMIGDSFAMCYYAGLPMVNMEFLQIGYMSAAPVKRILSAPVWRLNPRLVNRLGESVLEGYLPEGVTAREIFSIAEFPYTVRLDYKYLHQAVYGEWMKAGGGAQGVFLDVTGHSREEIRAQAPYTYEVFKTAGLDMAAERIPVAIGVQTFHGGCLIDENAETQLKRLYVCGEAAGGLMGAERPGGNALAECQVFGNIAGRNAAGSGRRASVLSDSRAVSLAEDMLDEAQSEAPVSFAACIRELRRLMAAGCLTIRNVQTLRGVIEGIDRLYSAGAPEHLSLKDRLSAANGLTAARLIAVSALAREDSRGGHFRSDFPVRRQEFDGSVSIQKIDGKMQVSFIKL